MKASATISALMAPALISSLSSDIPLPVLRLISVSGLNPALIICRRSCPISLPVALICEKASDSDWKRCASPIDMSPIALSIGMTFSASMLKPSMVCAPAARSFSMSGVDTAKSFSSPNIASAFAWSPSSTENEVCSDCISLRTFTMLVANVLSPAAPRLRPANAAVCFTTSLNMPDTSDPEAFASLLMRCM